LSGNMDQINITWYKKKCRKTTDANFYEEELKKDDSLQFSRFLAICKFFFRSFNAISHGRQVVNTISIESLHKSSFSSVSYFEILNLLLLRLY
jgi:hypothetical protein